MHRQMIKMVNFELTANGLLCVESWQKVPPPNDKIWPAPILIQEPNGILSELLLTHKEIIEHADAMANLTYLKSVSLNELGNALSENLHRELHEFYADSEAETLRKCQGNEYKSPTCDDLTSNISSQVNRHFWKIHTYVYGFIGKWLDAHG